MSAPKRLHELLDAAWDHNGGGIGTGIKLYRPVFRRGGGRWAAHVGGEASGFRISALQEGEGDWKLMSWHGEFTEEDM